VRRVRCSRQHLRRCLNVSPSFFFWFRGAHLDWCQRLESVLRLKPDGALEDAAQRVYLFIRRMIDSSAQRVCDNIIFSWDVLQRIVEFSHLLNPACQAPTQIWHRLVVFERVVIR
jgi:hypothetical protein